MKVKQGFQFLVAESIMELPQNVAGKLYFIECMCMDILFFIITGR
jgi:hypothetical protein